MFDLNEDLILEVYNVRWLVWVQLLVTIFLLLVLLCGFSTIFGDLSDNPACSSSSSVSSLSGNHSRGKKSSLNASDPFQVEGIHHPQHDMDAASTSKGSDGEESTEGEMSVKDAALLIPFGQADRHPCNFLGLAKEAILKCLGLDALFETSIKRRRHTKDD